MASNPNPTDSPPPYSRHPESPSRLSTTSTTTTIPPQSHEPGFAPETLLTRGLQIPTRSDLITSGFLYPSILTNYHISKAHWEQFTREITEEARLSSRQWTTAVANGLGAFAVGGLMVGALGAIPAIWVARRTQRSREEQNFFEAARTDEDRRESRLSGKIAWWNESFFRPRGVLIRVDLPWEELEDMREMDLSTSPEFSEGGVPGSLGIRMRKTRDDGSARESASRRARIVVIPLPSQFDGDKDVA